MDLSRLCLEGLHLFSVGGEEGSLSCTSTEAPGNVCAWWGGCMHPDQSMKWYMPSCWFGGQTLLGLSNVRGSV